MYYIPLFLYTALLLNSLEWMQSYLLILSQVNLITVIFLWTTRWNYDNQGDINMISDCAIVTSDQSPKRKADNNAWEVLFLKKILQ